MAYPSRAVAQLSSLVVFALFVPGCWNATSDTYPASPPEYETSDSGASAASPPDAGAKPDAAAPPQDGGSSADAASEGPTTESDAGADAGAAQDAAETDARPHPLAGRYAVRTQLYAKQEASLGAEVLELVSKTVVLSLADIADDGSVSEQYCFLELPGDGGIASWASPAALQQVAPVRGQLVDAQGTFVRAAPTSGAGFGWDPALAPEDCVSGQTHASGCSCGESERPERSDDCRVTDADSDGAPGAKLYIDLARPSDPNQSEAPIALDVAATLAIGWELHSVEAERVRGAVTGGFTQLELGRSGELAALLGAVTNTVCPATFGHVELVRSDASCDELLEGRTVDPDSYGVFDVSLDGAAPSLAACDGDACAADTDADGTNDCDDACPEDPLKQAFGACGCGVPDTDADADGVPACRDACDNDANKTSAGVCGCGVPDQDIDGDGLSDCIDACPDDDAKLAAGVCGCGVSERDADGDGSPDCVDACPRDPSKVSEGICGCGAPELDSDQDGTFDCKDLCPQDPDKTVAGQCGCSVADVDGDGDGAADCIDLCPDDPAKTVPGACGCGVADTEDTDGDGVLDCSDDCPSDPAKLVPGACGCGVAETPDTDGDGVLDCQDACPSHPERVEAGECGCEECPIAPPISGTYAARSSIYTKSNLAGNIDAQKTLSYTLVTIEDRGDGTARMVSDNCWLQTLPSPSSGTPAYSWSPSSVLQARPPVEYTLVQQADGSWERPFAPERSPLGWDPARQPADCGGGRVTPPPGWNPNWGARCRCNDTELPPFDFDGSLFDCRLTDPDNDGLPGVSAFASTSPPAHPSALPQAISATVYGVSSFRDRWVITPASSGRHTGYVEEDREDVAVGCTGLACWAVLAPPASRTCPLEVNRLQLVPVTSESDTCDELLAARDSLFDASLDAPWPSDSACPPPPAP